MRRILRPLLSLCLGLIAIPFYGQTYRNPFRVPLPGALSTIFSGDFNGDAVPDLFYFDSLTGKLNVSLAHANGSYTTGPSTGIASAGIAFCTAADVNEDHFDDLICPSPSGITPELIAIYLGNGDGSFQSPRNLSYPDGSSAYLHTQIMSEALAADVNADGHVDLILTTQSGYPDPKDTTYTFLGDGTGNFPSVKTTVYPDGHYLAPLLGGRTFLDINHDGHLDIYDSMQGYYLGKGDGTFQWIGRSGTPQNDTVCVLADFDGDRRPDEACSGQVFLTYGYLTNFSLDIFHGNGDGTFGSSLYHSVFRGSDFFYPIRALDLNSDGIIDIVAQSFDGYAVLLGKPGLQFAPPVKYALTDVISSVAYSLSFVRDYNHDGQIDLAMQASDSLYLLYGHPDGSFDPFPLVEAGTDMGFAAIADFNNDHVPDVITTGNTDPMLSLGNGDGTFVPATAIHPAAGSVNVGQYDSSYILAGDFNGDGRADFLTSSLDTPGSSGVFYLFPGNGDGTFANPVPVTYPSGVLFPPASRNETQPLQYKILDLNGDARQDILTYGGNSNKGVNAFLSNGDGSFSVISNPYSAAIADPPVLAFADFNNDGKLDVAVLTNTANQLLLGTGGGHFTSAATTPPAPLHLNPVDFGSAVAGDFDGDGNQDIAVLLNVDMDPSASGPGYSNNGISQLWVYYGHGDGSFSSAVLATSSNSEEYYRNLILTGPNNHGLPDFVASYNESAHIGRSTSFSLSDLNGYAALIHNLPGRTFSPITPLISGLGVSTLAAADFNNDGFPDLLIANGRPAVYSDGNAFEILLNNGGPLVRGLLSASPEPSQIHQPFTLTASLTPSGGEPLAGTISFSIDGNSVGSAPLSNNSAALSVSAPLSIGQHALTATWPGDSTYPPATLTGTHAIVGVHTSTTLVSSPNPALAGRTVTLTATVSDPTASGTVTFQVGAAVLGSANVSSGVAVFPVSTLSVGSNNITATYSGDAQFATSTSPVLIQEINAIGTTAQLVALPNPALVGENVTLTATVANTVSSVLPPTGTVTFFDGTRMLGSVPLDGSGKATVSTLFTSYGNHILTAQYSGDATHATATSTAVTEVVKAIATSTSLNSFLTPSTYGQSVIFTAMVTPAPTNDGLYLLPGSVTFKDGGTTLAAVAVTTPPAKPATATFATSTLSVGTHTITATYSGNTAATASVSNPVAQVVTLAPSAVSLTAAPNPAYQHQSVTLTAAISSGVVPATGGIQFLDGANLLATVAPNASGVATFPTSTLAVGTHSLTAVYLGDIHTAASTSTAVSEVIKPSDFSLVLNPGSVTLVTGHHTTLVLTATSIGNFADTLHLSISDIPLWGSASFNPSTVSLSTGGTATSSLYLETDEVTGFLSENRRPSAMLSRLCALLPFVLVLPAALRRRRLPGLLCLALLCGVLLALSGCSGHQPSSIAPGSYTLHVTASGASSGLSHTIDLPLTVTE